MRLVLFSIYDAAAGSFMRPFPVASDKQAHRAFKDLVTDADHPIGKHPEDYTLHRLGVFDDQTGEFHNEVNEQQQTGLAVLASSRAINKEQMQMFHNSLNGEAPNAE